MTFRAGIGLEFNPETGPSASRQLHFLIFGFILSSCLFRYPICCCSQIAKMEISSIARWRIKDSILLPVRSDPASAQILSFINVVY